MFASDSARRALWDARSAATGLPASADYSMYTAAGNAAVHAKVLVLAELILSETLSPRAMNAAIGEHIRSVSEVHGEVYDTESAWAVVDALNPLLRRAGYAKVSRDDI